MGFKDQLEADASVYFNQDEFAQNVTYKRNADARSGDAEFTIDISAVVVQGERQTPGTPYTSEGQSDEAVIWLKVADVSEPKLNDEIITWRDSVDAGTTLGTDSKVLGDESKLLGDEDASAANLFQSAFALKVWRVQRVLSSDAVMHKVLCTANKSKFGGRR